MIDIDAEFRKMIGLFDTTANTSTEDTGSTITAERLLEDIRRIREELGPPPPQVRVSKHVPALGSVRPKSEALTDDMRAMVDDIGPQNVPIAYRINSQFGDMLVVNPVNVKIRK